MSNATNKIFAREPKQSRSRASMEKILSAAKTILVEKGYNECTLQEVSKLSKVSIGSIYCRFSGKEDLIRQVQHIELSAMDDEFSILVNQLRRKQLPLTKLLPALVGEFSQFLMRHQGILRAVMEVASIDELVAENGRYHYEQSKKDFEQLILECRDEIRQADPDRAVDMSFRVIYASLARSLGLGTLGGSVDSVRLDQLIDELSTITLYFLLSEEKQFS